MVLGCPHLVHISGLWVPFLLAILFIVMEGRVLVSWLRQRCGLVVWLHWHYCFLPGHSLAFLIRHQLVHLAFQGYDISQNCTPIVQVPLLQLFGIFFVVDTNTVG